MERKQPLLDIAAALADGTAVDWDSALKAMTSDEDRRLLAELRFIVDITHTTPSDSSSVFTTAARASASSSPDGSSANGASWGPLKILEHVGRGTFGDVYRAWDSRLDREVALKILRRRDRDDQTQASTVIQEGRLLARVRHPNVVTVYGAERINGRVGVWMEFVHGKTLEEALRGEGPFEVDRVIRIGIELSEALSMVHRAGLIHGDVKAQNVLCDRDGRVVLTDFGAGIELDETSDDAACALAGTPLSVAPEVLAGQPGSPRSDLYSLAVLLYHLLTGAYPVWGRSLKEVREAHTNAMRVPLHRARPDLRTDLVRIIDRALDPDPRVRHETLDVFHDEVKRIVPIAADTQASTSAPARVGRQRLTAAVVLAVFAIIPSMGDRARIAPNGSSSIGTAPRRPDGNWPTVVPEAYELYLRGSAAAERGGQTARLALQLFEQAITLDPAFAQAHAAIARTALTDVAFLDLSRGQRYERAKAAAERALALDQQLPEAHLAAAKVKSAIHDWSGAEREYRHAIALAPNRSLVREEYAIWLSVHGRVTEAIAEADRSVALDPLSPRSHYTAGLVRRFARRCHEGGAYLERAVELDPQYGPAHHEIGQCHQMDGRHDLAIEAYRRGAQPPGNLGHALAAAGRTAEARMLLAELIERDRKSGTAVSGIAMIHVGLGEYEHALDWLERNSSSISGPGTLKVAAVWDPLRPNPRFTEILRQRGLTP